MNAQKWKQRIIDKYLNETRLNVFVPREFLAYIKDRPDHECHSIFYGKNDAEAAQAYREELVRGWIQGLRVTVRTQSMPEAEGVKKLTVVEHELPAIHSAVESRKDGGGYVFTDPSDPSHVAEIARQAASALRSWLNRYEGTASLVGVDVAAIRSASVRLDQAAQSEVAA